MSTHTKFGSDGDATYDNSGSYGVETDRWSGPVNAEEFYADHLLDLLAESCGPLLDDDGLFGDPFRIGPGDFDTGDLPPDDDLPGVLDPAVAKDARARIRRRAAA